MNKFVTAKKLYDVKKHINHKIQLRIALKCLLLDIRIMPSPHKRKEKPRNASVDEEKHV